MAIDYDALAAAGGIGKGPTRYAAKQRRQAEKTQQLREAYAAVTLRDRHRCRVCRRWCDPHGVGLLQRGPHHHLVYRSLGGADTTQNICLLCPACHADEHQSRVRLSGERMCGRRVLGS